MAAILLNGKNVFKKVCTDNTDRFVDIVSDGDIRIKAPFVNNTITAIRPYTAVNMGASTSSESTYFEFENVSSIGHHAFGVFDNLDHYVTIKRMPKLTFIDSTPFYANRMVNFLDSDDNAFSSLSIIGSSAFKNLELLKGVNNLKNVSQISDEAFLGCSFDPPIISLSKCYYLGTSCFASANVNSISLPKLTVIKSYTFANCSNLSEFRHGLHDESMSLSNDFTYTFLDCHNLEYVEFENLEYVPRYCFIRCYKLKQASFPKATSILPGAFQACSSLTDEGLLTGQITEIGDTAFYGCISLKRLDFPYARSIEAAAFENCENLEYVGMPNAENSNFGGLFRNCYNLKSVDMPKHTSYIIANGIFSNCSSLEYIDCENATWIGASAFWNCISLKSANFDNVVSINNSAFNILSDAILSFPKCTSLSSSAFINVKGISELHFDTIPSVPSSVFLQCDAKKIYFNTASVVNTSAFRGCSSLQYAYLPEVTRVGPYAFYGCSKLEDVYMPNLISVNNEGFRTCIALKSLTLHNAENIFGNAFMQCSNLSYLEFDKYVQLSSSCFAYCSNLTTVIFRNGFYVNTGQYSQFTYCSKLASMYIYGSSLPIIASSRSTSFITYSITKFYVTKSIVMDTTTNFYKAFSSRIIYMEE